MVEEVSMLVELGWLLDNRSIEDFDCNAVGLARCELAIKFNKRKDLQFRALMENWDLQRVVRELY